MHSKEATWTFCVVILVSFIFPVRILDSTYPLCSVRSGYQAQICLGSLPCSFISLLFGIGFPCFGFRGLGVLMYSVVILKI